MHVFRCPLRARETIIVTNNSIMLMRKRKYASPMTEIMTVKLESRFLASLGGSTGENINGTKNIYDWDWDEE